MGGGRKGDGDGALLGLFGDSEPHYLRSARREALGATRGGAPFCCWEDENPSFFAPKRSAKGQGAVRGRGPPSAAQETEELN